MTTAADLTDEQRTNATLIADTVKALGGLVPFDQVCAVACAMQESSLINLPAGDKDSVGLFQQRPSQGWGTVAECFDPIHAITAFCEGTPNTAPGLFGNPVRTQMPIAVAIQKVQQSADGSLYAQWQPLAAELVTTANTTPEPLPVPPTPTPVPAPVTPPIPAPKPVPAPKPPPAAPPPPKEPPMSAPVPVLNIPAYYQGYPGRPDGIDFIVIHSVESPLETGIAESLARYYFGTTACGETSAHAIIGPDVIVEMVPPDSRAWQCGNGNQRGYGIEQSGYAKFTTAEWTTGLGMTQMQNVAWWAAKQCKALGIQPRWLTDQELATPGQKGFVEHADVSRVLGGTTHWDPGPGYPRDLLMQHVKAYLNDPTPGPTPPPEEDDMTPEQAAQLNTLAHQMSFVMQALSIDSTKTSVDKLHVAVPPYSVPNKLAAIRDQLASIQKAMALDPAGKSLPVAPYSLFNLLNQTHAAVGQLSDDLAKVQAAVAAQGVKA